MDINRLINIVADQKEELQQNDLSGCCKRLQEKQIRLDSKLAQVVIGVRRSGKSTICEKVLKESHIPFAYVNFDDERLAGMKTDDLNLLLEALYRVYGDFTHLFLDEIQNIEKWPLFVNRLLRQRIHLFITGSNSKLLSNELMTRLTGRHDKIELYPLAFSEYCDFKHIDTTSQSTKAIALRKTALENYLIEGGMPEMLDSASDRRSYIANLTNTIIKNDIAVRFKVRHIEVLGKLASYLADNYCQEFVASTLSDLFGVADHTIENYYGYLKQAFLLIGINKFSYKSKERIRNEKVYVVDTAFATDRPGTIAPDNKGWRLENVVLIELLRRSRRLCRDVFYWKEANSQVDFVVAENGKALELIQVTFSIEEEKTKNREYRGLLNASKALRCNNLTLITFDQTASASVEGKTINIVSAADWLAQVE